MRSEELVRKFLELRKSGIRLESILLAPTEYDALESAVQAASTTGYTGEKLEIRMPGGERIEVRRDKRLCPACRQEVPKP